MEAALEPAVLRGMFESPRLPSMFGLVTAMLEREITDEAARKLELARLLLLGVGSQPEEYASGLVGYIKDLTRVHLDLPRRRQVAHFLATSWHLTLLKFLHQFLQDEDWLRLESCVYLLVYLAQVYGPGHYEQEEEGAGLPGCFDSLIEE
jgi:hypothetical protein